MVNTRKPSPKHLTLTESERDAWIEKNPHALARLARELRPPVSRSAVTQVFRGKRASARISEALDRLIFGGRKRAA